MAIKPLTVPLPMAVSAGTGYAATYLKGKQEILKQRLQWAETELKQKYASDVAYEKDKQAAFASVEAELNALRKEREDFGTALRAAAAKGAKGGSDWRTTLLQEYTSISATIASETTKVSAIKADLLKTVQDTFTPPPGALDQATKAAQTRGAVSSAQTIDAGIDAYIGSPELATAFGGLSQGQKQSLAIHAYREMEQQIGVVQQGLPMTTAQAAKIKGAIAAKFGIAVADQDTQALEEDKKAFQDDVMSKAGTSLTAAKAALKYIQDQLALEGQGATVGDKVTSEAEIALRALAIDAYKNDGVISPEESAKAEELINNKVREITTAEIGTPEFEAAKKAMSAKLGFLDPSKSAIENYALTNVDDAVLQTYIREGELMGRKAELGPYQVPKQINAPTADDIMRRGAELYYPERTQRGFGKTAPFYAPETARARRAFEQGEDMTNPALGTSMRYSTPPGPASRFGPKEDAKGRRAPATSFSGASAQEIMGYTAAAREAIAANGGKFVPEAIDGAAGEIYNDIRSRYEKGELKFDDLYSEVSGSTTNSADMTATLGGADAAKEVKRKVLYNVLGSAYEKFLTNAPTPPPPPTGLPADYGDYANEIPPKEETGPEPLTMPGPLRSMGRY
jgi:hypothetical protein